MTGERPVRGVTPDSLVALHDAGYRELVARLGPGLVLDAGCGLGFLSAELMGPGRTVVGIDYDAGTAAAARREWGRRGLMTACTDASAAGLRSGAFDWVCSSHLIEHFDRPELHAAELARLLSPGGTALIVTPNRPADFENPFHRVLFVRSELQELLGRYFGEVWVGGLDGNPVVKADFAARRERAARVLALDVFRLRHRMPRRWYIALYTRALPFAYRLMARADTGGATGITAADFAVTEQVDDTTLVLVAIARRPLAMEAGAGGGPGRSGSGA
jgi:SAM-dependent methyltransferase